MINKEIFIHVGLHKTASTFLQQEVFPQFKSVLLIANPETQHNKAFNQLMYADDCFYSPNLVIQEINKIKSDRILISDECFSGQPLFFLSNNKTIIAKRLADLFPDAKIILFIRGQKDLMLSLYSQYLTRRNGVKNILELFRHPDFINELKKHPYYKRKPVPAFGYYSVHGFSHLDCFLHYETIHLYKSLFKSVHVLLYEDILHNPNKIKISLEKIIGEKLANQAIDFSKKINTSLKHQDFYKMLFFNRTQFLFRNIRISNIFYCLFRKLYLEHDIEQKENIILNKINKEYFLFNNQKIINEFPEINITDYPQNYVF